MREHFWPSWNDLYHKFFKQYSSKISSINACTVVVNYPWPLFFISLISVSSFPNLLLLTIVSSSLIFITHLSFHLRFFLKSFHLLIHPTNLLIYPFHASVQWSFIYVICEKHCSWWNNIENICWETVALQFLIYLYFSQRIKCFWAFCRKNTRSNLAV